jgi:hypothetical protein
VFAAALVGCEFRQSALGAYQGITVALHTTVSTPDGAKSVYRAYALYSDPGDYLLSVVGSQTAGNMIIWNLNSQGDGFGAGFYNPAGTNLAPLLMPGDP